MSTLREAHYCQPPEVADGAVQHRWTWTCDDCGAAWGWIPGPTESHPEWYGFLHMRLRIVREVTPGRWVRRSDEPRSALVVDGVEYTEPRIREILRERHELASELALLKSTLVLRTAALNRTSEALETLRSVSKPNP